MALALERDDLLNDPDLFGRRLCAAHSDRVDAWLAGLFESLVAADDVALVAVGGYGRAELAPGSDIDVMLLHGPKVPIADIAERLWYPIWDSGVKLGHSVRTISDALDLARTDLDTATALLSVRHLAGESELTSNLAGQARSQWRSNAKRSLAELAERVKDRHDAEGEVAFLLEPDLKEGRGGMRDVHALRWAAAADPVSVESTDPVAAMAYETLLSARVELHRLTGRRADRLVLQRQDEIADALGFADADDLMAAVASSARTIAWTSDATWHRIRRWLRGRAGSRGRAREVAPGVVLEDRDIRIEPGVDLADDPVAALRLAEAAATHQAFIDRSTLDRLANEAPPLPEPWPPEARGLFADLLLAGEPAIPVIEALDQVGLFVQLIPEWEPCRNRPQRNAYHRFTVDRHLLEAAARAAELVDEVAQPDLLVLGALLHDIGKGYPGDHTEVGMELVATIGERMGYTPDDVQILIDMVRLHLLLPDAATRRDLDDDGTIRFVADEVGTVDLLELLGALTVADSVATGPAAWGPWKAGLVDTLVERTAHVLRGGDIEDLDIDGFPSEWHLELMARREQQLLPDGNQLTVVAPDRPGLFARVAGALALNGVDILDAANHSNGDMGVEVFRVRHAFGDEPPWPKVVADLERALAGRLAIDARLAERVETYASTTPVTVHQSGPAVVFDNDTSAAATVVEVSGPDSIGVLYRVTSAFVDLDLDIVSSKVQTLLHDVVDSFYVRDRAGNKITDPEHLVEIERAVLFALQRR